MYSPVYAGLPVSSVQFNGPLGIAVLPVPETVLVTDSTTHVIDGIDTNSTLVSTIVGNGGAGNAGDGASW